MKKISKYILVLLLLLSLIPNLYAQGPKGKNFGFGLILGDPTGLTINYFTSRENSWDAYIGSSYFGNLRIGGDYLWHFDAFNSNIIKMYAGPGLVLGFGNGKGIWYKEEHDRFYYWNDNSFGMGVRVIFGVNIIPRNTPIEVFCELGPLVGITPNVGVNMDVALGIRFYP